MPTVSGTVTDSSGNVTPWSASWTVTSGGDAYSDTYADTY